MSRFTKKQWQVRETNLPTSEQLVAQELSPEERRRAQIVVCDNARTYEEAVTFLDMLGLLYDESDDPTA